jgi:peptidoglycan/xylan/chitin deacetylase (PgdA/CDA1 family)
MTPVPMARSIPILMYHNIGDPRGQRLHSLYVRTRSFARQMRLLKTLGIRGISITEALPYLTGERSGAVAVITFDDAYLDNLENALPELSRCGFTATCYVPTAAIGRWNLWDADELGTRKPVMNTEQIRSWCAAGMEVGAHTRTHPHLSDCARPRVREEIRGSKRDLEDLVGAEVSHFCYPYGDYDGQVLAEVRAAGFRTAVTSWRGRSRPGDDLLQLPRVLVTSSDRLHRIALKVLTPYEDRRGGDRGILP